MPTRNTNVTLNLTDDDEPAVQQQSDTTDTSNDTPETEDSVSEQSGHRNADGSLTVYGTSDPAGTETAENVPTSPLAAEISAFEQEIEYPDDFTATDRQVIAIQRLHPDLTRAEISDRLDISTSTISRAAKKAALAALSEQNDIHAAFHDRTAVQQAIIIAHLDAPTRSHNALAEIADCSPGTVSTVLDVYTPLIRHLDNVGLPGDAPSVLAHQSADEPPPRDQAQSDDDSATDTDEEPDTHSCEVCGATFDSPHARNGHKAVHSRTTETADAASSQDRSQDEAPAADPSPAEPSPDDDARQDITTIRRTVQRLYDAAAAEHSLCDPAADHSSPAARQATCEVILDQIDAILNK